jgi:hypothetical protein
LAKEFKVCDVALGRRFKGHGPRHGRSGTNNKLNIYQESALCSLIRVEDAFMATPTVQEVQGAANGVICHCSERPRAPLHKIWAYGFFKRDPELPGNRSRKRRGFQAKLSRLHLLKSSRMILPKLESRWHIFSGPGRSLPKGCGFQGSKRIHRRVKMLCPLSCLPTAPSSYDPDRIVPHRNSANRTTLQPRNK